MTTFSVTLIIINGIDQWNEDRITSETVELYRNKTITRLFWYCHEEKFYYRLRKSWQYIERYDSFTTDCFLTVVIVFSYLGIVKCLFPLSATYPSFSLARSLYRMISKWWITSEINHFTFYFCIFIFFTAFVNSATDLNKVDIMASEPQMHILYLIQQPVPTKFTKAG